MSQKRDRRLCEQRLSNLIPSRDPTWRHLSSTQAEISSLTLPHNRVAAACKPEPSPMAAQRTFNKGQPQSVRQPMANSVFTGTMEQRETFHMLSDKAHTCQKEP